VPILSYQDEKIYLLVELIFKRRDNDFIIIFGEV